MNQNLQCSTQRDDACGILHCANVMNPLTANSPNATTFFHEKYVVYMYEAERNQTLHSRNIGRSSCDKPKRRTSCRIYSQEYRVFFKRPKKVWNLSDCLNSSCKLSSRYRLPYCNAMFISKFRAHCKCNFEASVTVWLSFMIVINTSLQER